MHAVCRLLVVLFLTLLSILLPVQCFTAEPHEDERKILNEIIPQTEFKTLIEEAGDLLGVQDDQFDMSIRHGVVKNVLQVSEDPDLRNRGVTNIPLAVKHRSDNPDYLTWSACDTVLGEQVKKINLYTETRVTKFHYNQITGKIDAAILRDLNTNDRIFVIAKVWCIY